MKRFNNFRRLLLRRRRHDGRRCDDIRGLHQGRRHTGSNLVPDNQQMKAGYETFGALTLKGDLNPRRYVETRLYQTDSLITSNLTYGYMGSMLSDTFGLRTAGFLTQYVPYEIDLGLFRVPPDPRLGDHLLSSPATAATRSPRGVQPYTRSSATNT